MDPSKPRIGESSSVGGAGTSMTEHQRTASCRGIGGVSRYEGKTVCQRFRQLY